MKNMRNWSFLLIFFLGGFSTLEVEKFYFANHNNERSKLKKSHKVTVDKLKAKSEELKGEISLQYKAGCDKMVNQVLYFASRLKP
jgi:hypothetical protein